MKLAVISDLHGNYYALAKVLAFLRSQEIDGIIGLGDFVTDGPFPQRMMRVLREMQEEFPCGLHPELLLSHLENLDAAILLGGHSHKQEQREYAEKTYLNPGSLGLALDGVGGHAHFAILTLENSTWQIECFQIPYDLEGYLAEFDRAGLETHGSVLARSLKRTLTCGVNYFYLTVKRVRELADALALTDLDEEVWKKAEQELK